MHVARKIALWFSLAAWLYSWYLIRGLRHAYSPAGRDLGAMPSWLLAVMVVSSTVLLGAAVCAGMRVPAWPGLAAAGGLALFGLTVLGQYAVMNSLLTRRISLVTALNGVLETRGLLDVAIFVAGIPTVLLLSGVTGLASRRLRPAEADLDPHPWRPES